MKHGPVLLAALLAAWLAAPLPAAEIYVPALELFTLGSTEDGVFGLRSRGELDLRVEGGYKFGGRLVFGFFSDSLETAAQSTEPLLSFKAAGIRIRDIFALPLDFAYFLGEQDTFCSGELFDERFGADPFASRYPSWLHFPESSFLYEGIHTVSGTGFGLDFKLKKDVALLSLHLYQDGHFVEEGLPLSFEYGHWSADLRAALNLSKVKLEAFLGATSAAQSAYGYYRGGLLFYVAEQSVEFLLQAGIPRWAPEEPFGIDLLYLLVEPRVRLGAFSIVPTFFWRPSYFLLKPTREQAFDINLDLGIGKPAEWPLAGGLEGNFVYQTEDKTGPVNELRVRLSPYVQFITPGALWEVRLNAKILPFDATDLLEVLIAVKAGF